MTDSQTPSSEQNIHLHNVPSIRSYFIAGVLLLLFWMATSWLMANAYQSWKNEQTYLETRKSAEETTNGLQQRMTQTFYLLEAMPFILSQNSYIRQVLTHHHAHGQPLGELTEKEILSYIGQHTELQHISRTLQRLTRNIDIIKIFWLTEENGICIAASNAGSPQSFIGKNFRNHSYFNDAAAGKSVVRYSMGYYFRVPGIYFSSPVHIKGKVAGIVTAKVDLTYLYQWLSETNGFVVDRYGVIIYASDPAYQMLTLPGATVHTLSQEERKLRYGQTEFNMLPFRHETDSPTSLYLINEEDTPYYVFSAQLTNPDFQLMTAFKRPSRQETLLQAAVYFFLLVLSGFILILAGLALIYYIHHRRAINRNRIQQIMSRDALTGFYNRSMANPLIEQKIGRARQHNTHFAVLFVDIDHFKDINDSFGHEIGDEVLQQLANRFKSILQENDIIIRHAGDDFIILLDKTDNQEETTQIAKALMARSQQPFYIQNKITLTLSVSVGIVMFPEHGDTPSLLLRHADTALYYVKQNGRNNYAFYRSQMSTELLMRKSLENDMEHALENNEFFLVYQPQYCYAKKGIASCEALIRWRHPVHGVISPATFIPIAEHSGFIRRLGEWILNEACRQAREWHKTFGMTLSIAVNLSAAQFQSDLPETIRRIISRHEITPHMLDLEMTESILMKNVTQSLNIIQELKNLGARISLDDFGTGYSSLAYLQKFPIDILKIDRAFVSDMETNASNRAIINAIISMAQSLNYQVIAEGIETPEQYNLLMEMGCHIIQGYWFSKPLTADQFADFYAKNRCEETTGHP